MRLNNPQNDPKATLRSIHRRVALTLVLLSLACAAAFIATSGFDSPVSGSNQIAVSNAAADQLEENVRNQFFTPGRTDFRLSLSNEQATSFAALRNTALPLENPQIWFASGQVFLRGTFIGVCLFHPEVFIVATPYVQSQRLVIGVQQIRVGSIDLPRDWLPTISKSVTDSIDDAQLNLQFDRVEAGDGVLVLNGRLVSAHR